MHIFKTLDDCCSVAYSKGYADLNSLQLYIWVLFFLHACMCTFVRRSVTTPSPHPYREPLIDLELWLSKCGPKTRSRISISWKLSRNSLSLASPQTNQKFWPSNYFYRPSKWFWCMLMFEDHCFEAVLSNRNVMQATYIILNVLVAT